MTSPHSPRGGARTAGHVDTVVTHLPLALSAAGDARRFLRRELCPVHRGQSLQTVELLVTEMVTNAVVHAQSAPVLSVACNRDQMLFTVFDTSTAAPRTITTSGETGGETDDELGVPHGLQLVSALATTWGFNLASTGATASALGRPVSAGLAKGVWCTLRV